MKDSIDSQTHKQDIWKNNGTLKLKKTYTNNQNNIFLRVVKNEKLKIFQIFWLFFIDYHLNLEDTTENTFESSYIEQINKRLGTIRFSYPF